MKNVLHKFEHRLRVTFGDKVITPGFTSHPIEITTEHNTLVVDDKNNQEAIAFRKELGLKVFHLFDRDSDNRGGLTVVYRVLEDKIEFAVAICSLKDRYCKRTGRTIATAKFGSGEKFVLTDPSINLLDVIRNIAAYFFLGTL